MKSVLFNADLVVKTLNGASLKMAKDYVYLSSYIISYIISHHSKKISAPGKAWPGQHTTILTKFGHPSYQGASKQIYLGQISSQFYSSAPRH